MGLAVRLWASRVMAEALLVGKVKTTLSPCRSYATRLGLSLVGVTKAAVSTPLSRLSRPPLVEGGGPGARVRTRSAL